MVRNRSASPRKQKSRKIDFNLERRAGRLLLDESIPSQTRRLIQFGLDGKDRYLEQVVSRVEAGEMTIEHIHLE